MLTRSQQRHTVAACFLSWTLDAFDFFIMVFVLADIAKEFDTGMTAVTIAITLTLAALPGRRRQAVARRLSTNPVPTMSPQSAQTIGILFASADRAANIERARQ